ncbi:uncharacterized protein LOC128228198 [Mya arenaria]|uniref:uncharacterized protein LOC128228198 n=1 Tax=Mya arenaria TaxID=6604 RepID=UPI0022E52776|nr:uncharacterized protein LOC128228198 [Mya arenaria]
MATYTCENNASLVGNPTMVCQVQLGAWNGTEPRCSCPFLNDIENGVVTVDEAFLTATYVCDVNYTLTGGVLRTCDKSTYIWSGSEPSCVIEEATGGGAEATSGGTNLLPVVIVFAILTVVFGVGFAVALLYIFKLRKGKHNNKRPENHPPPNFDANHFKSSKTSPRSNGTDDTNSLLAGDGRLHSFQFLSRPPMEHRQHLLTSASSAIPRSSRAPHGHMNLGNFPKGKTQSDISAGNLNLHLIRETTTSSIYSGNPAPWSKHGDNDALESSMDSTIIKSHKKNILPAIIEKKNNSKPLSSPRKHKKESFGRRLKRQNSVGTTHGTELSLKDGQGEVVLGIGHKTYYR